MTENQEAPAAKIADPGRSANSDALRSRGAPRGLARGLDSLIPTAPPEASETAPARAPIGSISPNPSQPRTAFDQEQLEELAASIREHGILQPLLVQPGPIGRYELIAGERRWRAAGLAGLETVPIVVQARSGDDAAERLTLALVENLQRADLNPIEMAAAFEQLSETGWTQVEIATAVGKSRTSVANTMRLRSLSGEIQQLVASGALSEGHGRALLGAPETDRHQLAERAVDAGWTVRQLEQAVRAAAEAERTPKRNAATRSDEMSPVMTEATERLESALGTRVEVRAGSKGSSGGGRIVVHWYDEEQLSALAAQMSGLSTAEAEDAEEFGI